MEDDKIATGPAPDLGAFQSTSSVWRTTSHIYADTKNGTLFQSTSSVWRTTACQKNGLTIDQQFQSTSSVWRTTGDFLMQPYLNIFQSTSSVWRTTYNPPKCSTLNIISIHVLRVEDNPYFL